jgi:predicted nucleic-acid-binding Zn-ribbon protein
MKKGTCIKCGSEQVYTNIELGTKPIIPISTMGKAKHDYYVCINCGYSEIYTSNEFLDKIKDKWEKVK